MTMADRFPEVSALHTSRHLPGEKWRTETDQSMASHHRNDYAGHALYAHQYQAPSQNVALSMGHMVESLPLDPGFAASQHAAAPRHHQTNPHLIGAAWPYQDYQQLTHQVQYSHQIEGLQHKRRPYPPQGPALLPLNDMNVSAPYPVYPVHQPVYYPSPATMTRPYSTIEGQGRAQVTQPHAMSRGNPPTPYNHEMPRYPFHMAQIMQDKRFSSTGSAATLGSSSEHIATNGSSSDNLATSSISQGPPRKPRQSGHALWVGNLPPSAAISDLKDHFSRGLTNDIESLKLIARSNCAFVNYHTAAACAVAMQRFHDSRFHGTRLVCRPRRPSEQVSTAAGPGQRNGTTCDPSLNSAANQDQSHPAIDRSVRMPERFFVLKSLTVHDLETSLQTGRWATQSHNEEPLNQAYNSTEIVYLIFSANKSGEYFGFARMSSAIVPSADAASSSSPSLAQTSSGSSQAQNTPPSTMSSNVSSSALPPPSSNPRSITTAATEWAPRGKIIEDHARGTIFWEADIEDSSSTAVDGGDSSTKNTDTSTSPVQSSATSTSAPTEIEYLQSSGNSFSVEWLSTVRVPFYTTRGLRNPWNVNREVKVARDGTELEPSVGRKLLALFSHPAIGLGAY